MFRRRRRGVSQIIAQVLLVAMTISAGTILWAFRPPTPAQPVYVGYWVHTGPNEPTWGDGSDCTNSGPKGAQVQTCKTLPTIDLTIQSVSPNNVPLSSLLFDFICNGSSYLGATLSQMAWIPATPATVGGGVPQLGHCGSYVPPAAAWNRLAYFREIDPNSTVLQPGDTIVLYAHTFQPPNCPGGGGGQCDDDFHGAPEWCYTVLGDCTLYLLSLGTVTGAAMQTPLFGLST